MWNLVAVLALLPAHKVLAFYAFTVYEKMKLEALDALAHRDTIPVPMHNPRVPPELNYRTLYQYAAWKATPTVREGCGGPQQSFSLYAEDTTLSAEHRQTGGVRVNDRRPATHKVARDSAGAGARGVPFTKPVRLTVRMPGEPTSRACASSQTVAQHNDLLRSA